MNRRKFIRTGAIFLPATGLAQVYLPRRRAVNVVSAGYVLEQELATGSSTSSWANVDNSNEFGAVSFKAAASFTLTKFAVQFSKVGSPTQSISAAIYSTTTWPGNPSSSLQASGDTKSGSDISGDTWLEFTLAGTALTSGTYYALVFNIADNTSDTSNYYRFNYDNTAGGDNNRLYRKETAASWTGTANASSVYGAKIRLYSGSP